MKPSAIETLSEGNRTLAFVSKAIENIPPGWRAHETYKFTGEGEFTETFEMAEPRKDLEPVMHF